MRSSLDCCSRATASCNCWTCVCNCTISLLGAKAEACIGEKSNADPNTIAAIARPVVLEFMIRSEELAEGIGLVNMGATPAWSFYFYAVQPSPVTVRAAGIELRLAIERELGTAVLLPAGLALFGAELLFFAVADDAQTGGRDAGGDQRSAGSIGTVLAERQIVLSRATLVGISTDQHLDGWVRGEIAGGLSNRSLGIRTKVG